VADAVLLGLVLYCRWTYADFYKRYKVLSISKDVEKKNIHHTCENIISKLVSVSGVFTLYIKSSNCSTE